MAGGNYLYLRAWCRIFEVDKAEAVARLELARKATAPVDALFSVGDKWYRLRDIESPYVREALFAVVRVMHHEEGEQP